MSNHTMKEVDYTCTTRDCGNTQTVRYFPDEAVNPMLCCVRCRAGFGVEHQQMIMQQIGMKITGKPRMVNDEPKFRREGAFTQVGRLA